MSLVEMLDPRAKLALTLSGAIVLFVAEDWKALLGMVISLALLLMGLGLGLRWLRSLAALAVMASVVLVVSWLSFGWAIAALVTLRLAALVTLFFAFFQVTEPEDLGWALTRVGVPETFAFILAGAMRFVPVLSRKLADIRDAQQARGIDLRLGLRNWSNYVALLAPLLIQSFLLADQLALAMEARGFSCQGRSGYREYHMAWSDLLAVILALLLTAGVLGWRMLVR
jgi:energy-coupling factor transport system permease protein